MKKVILLLIMLFSIVCTGCAHTPSLDDYADYEILEYVADHYDIEEVLGYYDIDINFETIMRCLYDYDLGALAEVFDWFWDPDYSMECAIQYAAEKGYPLSDLMDEVKYYYGTDAVFDYTEVPMQNVSSSFILQCGYDTQTNSLLLRLSSGMLYVYHDVPPKVYEGFINAESLGTYFNSEIKNKYSEDRLEDGSDYNEYPFTICSQEEATYAVVVSSEKIHRLDCNQLNLAVHIKYTSDTMQELLGNGYQKCKRCNPE